MQKICGRYLNMSDLLIKEEGKVAGLFNLPTEDVFNACMDFCIEVNRDEGKEEIQKLKDQIKKYIQQSLDQTQKIKSIEKENNQVITESERLKEEINRLKAENKSLKKTVKSLTNENKTLREVNETQNRDILEAQTKFTNAIEKKNTKINELKKEMQSETIWANQLYQQNVYLEKKVFALVGGRY
eukprot:TRINITY_DN1109_c0_g4_i1.p1 TRINITY_DN1109_c0_g4~~TRINITY_DN1109_c0_g4_i1.p1  ORF type:complete len:185 (-),score=40.83 TRINITY_DN1109_c0_g4_i1:520-1074(-)